MKVADCNPFEKGFCNLAACAGRPLKPGCASLGLRSVCTRWHWRMYSTPASGRRLSLFDDQLFLFVMCMPEVASGLVLVEQVSFFSGTTLLSVFVKADLHRFRRLSSGLTRRKSPAFLWADFLLYSLLDMVIDQGFPVLESFGMELEELKSRFSHLPPTIRWKNSHRQAGTDSVAADVAATAGR